APFLCTHTTGFYYAMLPDYYQVGMVLMLVTVIGFFVVDKLRRVGICHILILGCWIGLVGSNKISWLPFGALVLAPVVARQATAPRQLLLTAGAAGSAALLTFVLVPLAVYSFNLATIQRVAPGWLRFVLNPGQQPTFWTEFVDLYLTQYNYFVLFVLFCVTLVVVAARLALARCSLSSRRRDVLVVALIIGVALFSLWSVIQRPAGTTAFETTVMVIGLTALLIGRWGRDPIVACTAYIGVLGLIVLALSTFQLRHNISVIADSGERAAKNWEIYDDIVGRGHPAVVVIPDNTYAFESVAEGLLKGFIDGPTWNIAPPGQARLDRLTGG